MKMQETLTYGKITEIIQAYYPKQNSWRHYTIPLFLCDFLNVHSLSLLYLWLTDE